MMIREFSFIAILIFGFGCGVNGQANQIFPLSQIEQMDWKDTKAALYCYRLNRKPFAINRIHKFAQYKSFSISIADYNILPYTPDESYISIYKNENILSSPAKKSFAYDSYIYLVKRVNSIDEGMALLNDTKIYLKNNHSRRHLSLGGEIDYLVNWKSKNRDLILSKIDSEMNIAHIDSPYAGYGDVRFQWNASILTNSYYFADSNQIITVVWLRPDNDNWYNHESFYEKANASWEEFDDKAIFKGISFGSKKYFVDSKVGLIKDNYNATYSESPEYTSWASTTFDRCYFNFNSSGELFKVSLIKQGGLVELAKVQSILGEIFGPQRQKVDKVGYHNIDYIGHNLCIFVSQKNNFVIVSIVSNKVDGVDLKDSLY